MLEDIKKKEYYEHFSHAMTEVEKTRKTVYLVVDWNRNLIYNVEKPHVGHIILAKIFWGKSDLSPYIEKVCVNQIDYFKGET